MDKDFLAIDIETATQAHYSVCEIGMVSVKDLEIYDRKRYLVQPPDNEYHYLNSQLHGISATDTVNELFFCDLWRVIENLFNKNLIVAHNAAFDIGCINATLSYYKIPAQPFKYECTYNLTGHGLDVVAAAYKIPLDHHHALADAEVCARIFINIQKGIFPEINTVDLSRFRGKTIWDSFGCKKIDKSDLQPDFDSADTGSPFYMKKVVFTGDLRSMDRHEAAHTAKKLGADVNTSISKKTDYVIVGDRPGPSKLKKIEALKSTGSSIKTLNEGQFLSIIKEFS